MTELLNDDQVAKVLNSSKRHVQNLRRAQRIPSAKFGKHWLFRKEDVEEYIEKMFDLQNKK